MSTHAKLNGEKVIAFTPYGPIRGALEEVNSKQEITLQNGSRWIVAGRHIERIKAIGS
jgi:hypothetical protein